MAPLLDTIIKLNRLAGNYLERSDHNKARLCYLEAIALLSKRNSTNDLRIKAILLNNLGHTQIRADDLDSAQSSFSYAAEIYLKLDDIIGAGQQFGNVGSVCRDKGMWDAAQKSYERALSLFESVSYKAGMADQCSNIGYICTQKHDYPSALKWYSKAFSIYKELHLIQKAQLVKKNIEILTS